MRYRGSCKSQVAHFDEFRVFFEYGTQTWKRGGGTTFRRQWTLHYSPEANDGRGRVTVTLDDESVTLDLTPEARKGNATFNRFGIVSLHQGVHFVEIYFNDISYTGENRGDSGA